MDEPAAPEPSRGPAGDTEAGPSGGGRRYLPTGIVAVALVAAGVAALLGLAALVAASRGSGDAKAELVSLRQELAKLSDQTASIDRELAEQKAGRIAGLEKALRETKDALPGGPPLGPSPELARVLEEMARVEALPSLDEGESRHLRNRRKSFEEQHSQLRRQHEEERTRIARDAGRRRDELTQRARGRRNELHESIQRETLERVRRMLERAREAEHRKDWQGALQRYRDVAGLEIRGAADMVADGRRKLFEVGRKIEGLERAEREKRREAGRKGRPHGPDKAREEIF
ncbi:MAG: hypothetical protein ACYSU0_01105 [Planctomycetota bacterium]|jgi:hypothetical protein